MTADKAIVAALNDYEAGRLAEIRDWQAQAPGWGTRLLAKPGSRAAKAVQAMVPVSALRGALTAVNQVAEKLADARAIHARAGVASSEALRALPLERLDALAATERRRAMAMGGASGAVFGAAGAAGMVADVPALLTLALRTVHRVGLCYGEDPLGEHRSRLAIGVFALASANSLDEKQIAVAALRDLDRGLLDVAWREGIERAAERELAKEAAVFSLQSLASRVGIHLGKRKAAGVLPVLGAVIGSSINAWYLHDIARCAQFSFQERWLRARYPTAEF